LNVGLTSGGQIYDLGFLIYDLIGSGARRQYSATLAQLKSEIIHPKS
jgi:hypothetical protein